MFAIRDLWNKKVSFCIRSNKTSNRAVTALNGLSSLAIILYVGFVYRAIAIDSFPTNRDVTLHLSQHALRSATPQLFDTYDFTAGLGNRTINRAHWLNPLSLLQHYGGVFNGYWLVAIGHVVLATIAYALIARRRALPNGTAQISAFVFAIWLVVPSTLRVGKLSEFGGPHFSLVTIGLLGVLVFLPHTTIHNSTFRMRSVAICLLVVLFAGSQYALPILVWSYAILVTGFSVSFHGWKNFRRGIGFVISHGLVASIAVLMASMIGTSSILTILGSSSRRSGAYRGVGDAGESLFVIWQIAGATHAGRLATTAGLSLTILIVWGQLSTSSKQILVNTLKVALLIQTYSLIFLGMRNLADLEIGPRPIYIAELLFLPLLALVSGILGSSLIGRLIDRLSHGTRTSRHKSKFCALIVIVLPLAALSAWSVKNRDVAMQGLLRHVGDRVPIQLTNDSRVDRLLNSRILIVDSGQQFANGVWHPSQLFAFVNNRDRNQSIAVFSLHGHELTRWQHWLFESQGANGGLNASIFLWARSFRPELAAILQATHVVSDKPLADNSLKLMLYDSENGGLFLYSVSFSGSAHSNEITQVVEADSERATELAVSGSLGSPQAVVLSKAQSTLVRPTSISYETQPSKVSFSFTSSGHSLAVLPIEFSHCHTFRLTNGETSTTQLIPVNGRFLGMIFNDTVEGEISFRSSGPRGLWCQIRDLIDTRSIG